MSPYGYFRTSQSLGQQVCFDPKTRHLERSRPTSGNDLKRTSHHNSRRCKTILATRHPLNGLQTAGAALVNSGTLMGPPGCLQGRSRGRLLSVCRSHRTEKARCFPLACHRAQGSYRPKAACPLSRTNHAHNLPAQVTVSGSVARRHVTGLNRASLFHRA